MIIRWALVGTGNTREEALADLQKSFDEYRQSHDSLPRPGAQVEITFASSEVVSLHADIARAFFPPVLGYNFDECFISDGSSVWDFPLEYNKDELTRRVLLIFGTDVADLAENGNIAAILQRIAAHRRGE
ncbi:MAG TPA: hypothetical protein VJZ76_22550 [Thermoanaerobaculia bacterium]|nr:hypothetical protein [Thermoanaerobaculia bacterium]